MIEHTRCPKRPGKYSTKYHIKYTRVWLPLVLTWFYLQLLVIYVNNVPDSKVHGANMGSIWDRQDLGGPHVDPMNLAIWGTYIFVTVVFLPLGMNMMTFARRIMVNQYDEIKCRMKLLIHSQTSTIMGCTVEVWEWISNFFPNFIMDELSTHAEIKVNPC